MTDTTSSPAHPTPARAAVTTAVLELADGTRLVPDGEATPARLEGGCGHAFTLADVRRAGAEPFAGYVRR